MATRDWARQAGWSDLQRRDAENREAGGNGCGVFMGHRADCLCDGCFMARGWLWQGHVNTDPRGVWCDTCQGWKTLSGWCGCAVSEPGGH